MVVPFVESHSDWTFRGEFPGQPGFPSPGLVAQVSDLVDRIILEPADPAWPDLWAKVYGPDGEARLAVAVIHASSDAIIDSKEYVEGLDAAASEIEAATGVKVGFLLDALPPGSFAPGRSFPTPASSAGPMSRSVSVLGISCFIPEIWVDFGADPGDAKRLAWKRDFTAAWVDSGVPTFVDVTPGYDASLVFPGSVRYGHSLAWRDGLASLVERLRRGRAGPQFLERLHRGDGHGPDHGAGEHRGPVGRGPRRERDAIEVSGGAATAPERQCSDVLARSGTSHRSLPEALARRRARGDRSVRRRRCGAGGR